jgi:hypothetical protein
MAFLGILQSQRSDARHEVDQAYTQVRSVAPFAVGMGCRQVFHIRPRSMADDNFLANNWSIAFFFWSWRFTAGDRTFVGLAASDHER